MTDLVSWLSAQLDADEQIARAATPGAWSATFNRCVVNDAGRRVVASVAAHECWPTVPDATFIAANGPAHVLRTIAAHRAILKIHADSCDCRSFYAGECRTLLLLGAIYESRDGWDPAWKVEAGL